MGPLVFFSLSSTHGIAIYLYKSCKWLWGSDIKDINNIVIRRTDESAYLQLSSWFIWKPKDWVPNSNSSKQNKTKNPRILKQGEDTGIKRKGSYYRQSLGKTQHFSSQKSEIRIVSCWLRL